MSHNIFVGQNLKKITKTLVTLRNHIVRFLSWRRTRERIPQINHWGPSKWVFQTVERIIFQLKLTMFNIL